MALRLTTYGGAETVTGSNFLVEGSHGKVLVDCGIEQGKEYAERRAYEPFPYDVSSIDALVITHAHLDHVGRAPRLVREGFRGKVYMTAPTRDLTAAILHDSIAILADNARKHNLPVLYEAHDVETLLSHIVVVPYRKETEIAPGLTMLLRDTGHILGSASVRLRDEDGSTLAITSDIGNSPALLLPDAEPVTDASVVLMESVYGDRENPEKAHREEKLRDTLKAAIARGGTILMPAFSIERTQLMLYEISRMFTEGQLPKVPVFLDSPLAISVTDIYRSWGGEYFNTEAKNEMHAHDLFSFPFLHMTRSREESQTIGHEPDPKIIIAGAGMSHGGRIGRWEVRYLPDPKTTLILVGYQAPGSPGRMMQDGAKKVRIDGKEVKIRATIETLHGWSGHADRDGLLRFAEACTGAKAFIVGIGEPSSARFLAQRIHDFVGKKAVVPVSGETFEITPAGLVRGEFRA
ncbi:MAG TPA: MBL fold metallo-hydrolase [Candidatus Paceibacterota bacterium]|nr:MBL fold metallo-hydrolase [Candidatus Paceibacterota bacterium]